MMSIIPFNNKMVKHVLFCFSTPLIGSTFAISTNKMSFGLGSHLRWTPGAFGQGLRILGSGDSRALQVWGLEDFHSGFSVMCFAHRSTSKLPPKKNTITRDGLSPGEMFILVLNLPRLEQPKPALDNNNLTCWTPMMLRE